MSDWSVRRLRAIHTEFPEETVHAAVVFQGIAAEEFERFHGLYTRRERSNPAGLAALATFNLIVVEFESVVSPVIRSRDGDDEVRFISWHPPA